MTRHGLSGAATLLLLLTACAALTVSNSPGATETARPQLGVAAEIGCAEPVNLIAPNGRSINLTGLWSPRDSPEPYWNIRQIGQCFFLAMIDPSSDPQGPPGYYDQICDGEIRADFVITARCIDFLQREAAFLPSMGAAFFMITFASDGEPELVRCLELDSPATCDAPLVPWEAPANPSPG